MIQNSSFFYFDTVFENVSRFSQTCSEKQTTSLILISNILMCSQRTATTVKVSQSHLASFSKFQRVASVICFLWRRCLWNVDLLLELSQNFPTNVKCILKEACNFAGQNSNFCTTPALVLNRDTHEVDY